MKRTIIGGTDVTDYINKLVAEAPPFTEEQKDKLRRILTAPRTFSPEPKTLVYFIQRPSGLIKIGVSAELPQRLKALRNMGGEELTVLATQPGGFPEERRLHERFASARVFGEWFRPVPQLLLLCRELRTADE